MHIWDVYFSSVVGMYFHPGQVGDRKRIKDLPECAAIADYMCRLRTERLGNEESSVIGEVL